jgi:hypothetical protein
MASLAGSRVVAVDRPVVDRPAVGRLAVAPAATSCRDLLLAERPRGASRFFLLPATTPLCSVSVLNLIWNEGLGTQIFFSQCVAQANKKLLCDASYPANLTTGGLSQEGRRDAPRR